MKMSREQLQANYEASTRENSLLRFAMMDMVNDSITWRAWETMGDGTLYRYGWARLDSASGGYLVWIFRAPGQCDFVRVDYLDAMHERRPSYGRPEDNALITAIDAARYARTRIYEKIHGYGCACSDCGKKREDKKATKPNSTGRITKRGGQHDQPHFQAYAVRPTPLPHLQDACRPS